MFLEKLSADVFPLYCQLAKEGKLAKGRNDFGKALWGKSPYDALTDDGGLRLALSRWAAHFNAEAEWLMVGIAGTSLRPWWWSHASELRQSGATYQPCKVRSASASWPLAAPAAIQKMAPIEASTPGRSVTI